MRQSQMFDRLRSLGFSQDEAEQLRRISLTLSHWAERECNEDIRHGFLRDGKTQDLATITLTLGEPTTAPDGIWFAVREWQRGAYRDIPGLYSTEYQARDVRDRMMAGTTRTVRYSVHQGYVTTRKELG